MIHYHVWFSLKPEVSEVNGLRFAHAFIDELKGRGVLLRGAVLKNTGSPPKSRLARYHAMFEFRDDEQMASAFAGKRSEGIHHGPHGQLMEVVSEFHVEVFKEV
jgi:hypothetical protein